mmetsp:Transcript_58746/g.117996  ORF Transcript_58746/g.117996 Transcript_58746/m.117996 type:complete len:225 (-) Transcript_58746:146-820(-)
MRTFRFALLVGTTVNGLLGGCSINRQRRPSNLLATPPDELAGLLEQLITFQSEYGHANVPLGSPLGRWVNLQRRLKVQGKLGEEEVVRLEELGLSWRLDPDELPWETMLAKLQSYCLEFGDALVPKKYARDPLLGAWVAACRRRKLTLSTEQRLDLDEADFEWTASTSCGSAFMQGMRAHVEALEADQAPDVAWADAQRKAREKGVLSEMRIAYLDGAGFEWGV